MTTPNKQEYEKALETIKKYEKRQKELNYLTNELMYYLKQFSQVKFKVDKKNKEVLFSGILTMDNRMVMSKSKCVVGDKFEPVIGKLLAIKKALNEDVSDILKLVEQEYRYTLTSAGITVNGQISFSNL